MMSRRRYEKLITWIKMLIHKFRIKAKHWSISCKKNSLVA